MKQVLKFSGIISLILVVVAFILMMATNACMQVSGSLQVNYAGTTAIFGHQGEGLLDPTIKLAPLALIAWILILVGMIIVAVGIILPLLKVTALEKFAGLLNLIAVVCFVLGGVFMFIVVPSLWAANDWGDIPDNAKIGAGWVIGGILAIVGGAFAILPAAMDFIGKKK